MRSREEIKKEIKEANKRSDKPEFMAAVSAIVSMELLMDIRDLLSKK